MAIKPYTFTSMSLFSASMAFPSSAEVFGGDVIVSIRFSPTVVFLGVLPF